MHTYRFIRILPVWIAMFLSCKPGMKPEQQILTEQSGTALKDSTRILFIGTYNEGKDNADGKAPGIFIYEINLNTGRLSYVSSSPYTINPSYLFVDPDRQRLYAVNETGNESEPSGMVSAYRLTMQGRQMEYINSVPSQGSGPCYITMDKTGNVVMCANYGSGTVAAFPVLNDGSVGAASASIQHSGKGPRPEQESAHAHMIIQSPHNHFIYACDLGTDNIYIYKLDTIKGLLVSTGTKYATQSGAGPRHLAFHPAKHFTYVVNELNGTIEVMTADSLSGNLKRLQIVPTLAEGMGNEASCADIHLTPSGNFLYASNRGKINNLAMYSVDQETGKLTLIGHQALKGKTPRGFVIDPTGTFLLVANQDSDNVVTFRIDQSTGKLIDTGAVTSIPTPVCLKFLL